MLFIILLQIKNKKRQKKSLSLSKFNYMKKVMLKRHDGRLAQIKSKQRMSCHPRIWWKRKPTPYFFIKIHFHTKLFFILLQLRKK